MKRQKLRKALILISFLFFPVTLFYFSPVLIIMGAHEGVMAGCFIMFGLQLVGALFVGRLFCGWACPAAGLQEACFAVKDKRASNKYNWIKYLIWVPWITTIALTALSAGGFKSVDFLYQTKGGVSVAEPGAYVPYFAVVGTITVLAFTAGKRAFCHYGCWMAPFMIIGTGTSNALSLPALRLRVKKAKCIECKKCNKVCPMSLDVMEMVQAESMRNSECILCGSCVDTCSQGAIRYSFGRLNKGN